MGTINLTKGQGVNLRKDTGASNLKRLLIGLGWDPEKSCFSPKWDIDASVICIDTNGREEDVIYYRHLEHRSRAIIHNGDNITGVGDGDDETIEICLDKIPENIARLSIIINIFDAYSRRQDFSKVKHCFARVEDIDTGNELVRYDISGNSTYKGKTGLFIADLYRYNGEWKFKAIDEAVTVRGYREMVAMKCR